MIIKITVNYNTDNIHSMSRRGGTLSVSPYKLPVDPAAPDER